MQVNPNAAQLHAISGASVGKAPAPRPDAAAQFQSHLQAATTGSGQTQAQQAPAPAQKSADPAAAEKAAATGKPMPRGSFLDIVA